MKKYLLIVLLVASVFAQSRDCSYSTVSGVAVASPNIGTIDLVLSFTYDCIGFGNADGVQFNFPDGFSSYVNSWAITGNGNVCSFGTDSGQNCNNLEGTYDGDSLLFGTVATGNGFGGFENSNVFTVNVDPWFAGDPIDAFEMLTIGYVVYDGNFNPVNGVGEFTIIEFSQAILEHVISTSAMFASCVYAEDVDGDGDMDVLSSSRHDNKIAWYENDGSGSFTEEVISTSANGASSVYG